VYEGWQIAAGRELDQLGGLLFDSFGTFLIVDGELALVDAFLKFLQIHVAEGDSYVEWHSDRPLSTYLFLYCFSLVHC
jgi:hypothetical protein